MVVMSRKSKAINESRKQITSTSLIENHRSSDKCFTRKRSLSFIVPTGMHIHFIVPIAPRGNVYLDAPASLI